MKIALVTSEAVPFSKTGGLADVTGTLFREYNEMGIDVSLFVPLYKVTAERFAKSLTDSGIEIDVPLGREFKKCRLLTCSPKGQHSQNRGAVYFISNDEYFGRDDLYGSAEGDYPDNDKRFIFFCKSVLKACRQLDLRFDIFHCNDWQTALIPFYLMTLFGSEPAFTRSRTIFTIHNLGYQGLFPAAAIETSGLGWEVFNPEGIEFFGNVNFLKAGLISADLLTTVSPTYAKEILSPEKGFGLDGVLRKRRDALIGVLNGIDYNEWDPATDTFLPANYSKDDISAKAKCKKELMTRCSFTGMKNTPLLCFIGRLSEQKGLDLLAGSLDQLMKMSLNLFVLGKGDEHFRRILRKYAIKYPGRMFFRTGFDDELAHLAYAGSDIFLMPSIYEPCGLGQMISMRYGTIPVAFNTGGLADTITVAGNHTEKFFCERIYGKIKETGFLFYDYSTESLLGEIKKALCIYDNKGIWEKLMRNAMEKNFSWEKSAGRYLDLYNELSH